MVWISGDIPLVVADGTRSVPASAPVIASNQQGESPCRSELALRNRR